MTFSHFGEKFTNYHHVTVKKEETESIKAVGLQSNCNICMLWAL